ncbi:unnamed protein product [Clonostachys rosea f. rosea IK726]|uniref:Dienelactone hydrolase domain-containing protein n=2 Tax=Bionectria ochroleuca TaxID=29856 RepID=A0A0B7KLQ9_BIOOC|nr:unnamed protein product [Clonostachys rosea f. rosea IK726]
MSSLPPSDCCATGFKHNGSPQGKTVKLAGKWDAYIATPAPGQQRNDTALLYLPDVLGIWINSKLMADEFASNGYLCVIPDLFHGDAIKINDFEKTDVKKWIEQGTDGSQPHTPDTINPIVSDAIQSLKKEYSAKKIGVLGYCFGAKFAVGHFKNDIDACFLAHPSFVSDEELAAIQGPLSIAAADTDPIFPDELRHKSENILRGTGQPWQICLYSGVAHGFAVRGDLSKRAERFAKAQAFQQAIVWFNEHLGQ